MLWSKSILNPGLEFPLTTLATIEGKVPPELQLTLYRNGPGRLTRGNLSVGHWFDGDGAILAVHFTKAEVKATYRYVQTSGYMAETKANHYIYPNYGMTSPGPFWNNWGKDIKNSANTSVLALSDRLLALWEGGNPYALDLKTLETKGIESLRGGLTEKDSFSAHPKVDHQRQEIYNFGVVLGSKFSLNLYKINFQGEITKKLNIPLKGYPLIHDFVLAGPYLVFFIPPVEIEILPILLGMNSYSESMRWRPEKGTQVLVIDRETFSVVSQGVTDAWFQWHYSNGYQEKDGSLVIELARYPDFKTNQYLKEVATGKTQTLAKSTLWRVRLNPQTAQVLSQEEILDRQCEFPVVQPDQVGKKWSQTYLLVHPEGVKAEEEILGTIACLDHNTGRLSVADLGSDVYASEPIYVPNQDDGWILTVVYNGKEEKSEVRIYNSAHLEGSPVCRLGLPEVIPPSFHGTWKATTTV